MVDKTRTPPPPLRKIPPEEIGRPSDQQPTGVAPRGVARHSGAADAYALRGMVGRPRAAVGTSLDPVVDTPASGITRSGSFERIAENLQIENDRAPLSPEARRVLEGAFSA